MIRVVHVITDLNVGGAQMMLCKLLSAMDRERFAPSVISLTDVGPLGARVEALGVPLRALRMRRGLPDLGGLLRLVRWLRHAAPQVVQSWLCHADLVAGLAAWAPGARTAPVIWGVQAGHLDPTVYKPGTLRVVRVCAALSSRLPARIVCCSEAGRRAFLEQGYAPAKLVVIPNGCDVAAFRPDPAAREAVRRELRISADAPVVGLVARFDAQKDQRTFLRAATQLHARRPDVHFLLCGDGITWDNPELAGWIDAAGIRPRCHLLGRRDDVPRLNAALDVASSSSCTEGFSNTIGEGMACAVPCVVTDVGDSADLVGSTGVVVPPRDPAALGEALADLLARPEADRRALGVAARDRVVARFSLAQIVDQYAALYQEVATAFRRRPPRSEGAR